MCRLLRLHTLWCTRARSYASTGELLFVFFKSLCPLVMSSDPISTVFPTVPLGVLMGLRIRSPDGRRLEGPPGRCCGSGSPGLAMDGCDHPEDMEGKGLPPSLRVNTCGGAGRGAPAAPGSGLALPPRSAVVGGLPMTGGAVAGCWPGRWLGPCHAVGRAGFKSRWYRSPSGDGASHARSAC